MGRDAAVAAVTARRPPPLALSHSPLHEQQQRMPSPPPLPIPPATFDEARVSFDAVWLNKNIMRASRRSDWDGIVDMVTGFRFQLDPINIATSFSVLGKAVGRGECPLKSLEAQGGFLNVVWHRLLYVHDEMSARCICSIAYGLARMNLRDEKFLALVSRMARARISEFAAVDLANTAWSFATLRQADPPLFAAIAGEAVRRGLGGMEPQHISILLWSFAKVDQDAPAMLDAAAHVVRSAPEAYSSWSLSNVMWAYAKLGRRDEALFDALGGAALACIHDFSPQGIANVLWSLATLKLPSPPLLAAFAREAADRLSDFDPQSLSILAWSLASLGALTPDLCSRLAAAAAPAAPSLIPQQIATIAWAVASARAGHGPAGDADGVPVPCPEVAEDGHDAVEGGPAPPPDGAVAAFFAAASAAARPLLPSFNPQELSMLVWALAAVRHGDDALAGAVHTALLQRAGDLDARKLSVLAWALASARRADSRGALGRLLEAAAARMDEVEPQGASNLAWAMGSFKMPHDGLLEGVARVAAERAGEFSPQALCNVAWSFAALERHDAAVFAATAAEAARRLDADPRALTPQGVATLAWAFSHHVAAVAAARGAVPHLRPRDSTDDNASEAAGRNGVAPPLLDPRSPIGRLFASAARVAAAQAADFPPHALTTVASAFGSMHSPQPALFAAIARSAVGRMGAFEAGDVADLAGSFATLRHGDLVPEFVPAAAARVREVAPRLSSFQMNRVCWAFGAVFKFDCPRLVAALEGEIGRRVEGEGLDPMDAANVALGLAYLQAGSGGLLRGLAEGALGRMGEMDPRGAVNLSWSLVVRGEHGPAAALLAAAFPDDGPGHSFPAGGLGQLGCIRLALELERPDLLPSFPAHLSPAVDAHLARLREEAPSSSLLHRSVASDLARVRPGYVEEHFAGVYFLDFAWPEERLALEVDGPSHFLAVSGRAEGATALKERLLSAAGWRVMHLSHSEWRALSSTATRSEFLRRLLSDPAGDD